MLKNLRHRLAARLIAKKWPADRIPFLASSEITKKAALENLSILEDAPLSLLREIQYRNCLTLLDAIAIHNRFWRSYLADNNLEVKYFSRLDDLKNLSPIDKIFYRKKSPDDYLVSPYKNKSNQYFTSGSSGIPFQFFLDEQSDFWRYLAVLHGNKWAGAEKNDCFVRTYRPLHPDPVYQLANETSTFLTWSNIGDHYSLLEKISDKTRIVLYGFIEYFRMLMNRMPKDHSLNIRAIIITGETLNANERKQFESFFRTRVYISYSSREFGRIAQECRAQNGCHINAERFFIEITDDAGNPLPEGSSGKILITDTKNFVMPFIRFDIGDNGFMTSKSCACGRTLPRIFVENRNTDAVLLKTGERISPYKLYEAVERFNNRILRYQIVQEKPARFKLIIAPLDGFPENYAARIKSDFKKILGQTVKTGVIFTENDFVVKNGKQLPFVSLVSRSSKKKSRDSLLNRTKKLS